MVAPNIEGTYQLVRRELPEGTVQFPPAVKGMITYTKELYCQPQPSEIITIKQWLSRSNLGCPGGSAARDRVSYGRERFVW